MQQKTWNDVNKFHTTWDNLRRNDGGKKYPYIMHSGYASATETFLLPRIHVGFSSYSTLDP